MGSRTGATIIAVLVVIGLALSLSAAPAAADVGVEKVDRHAGRPGEDVRLTLACGFCFPPCEGPKGERHPAGFEHGPCMLDGDQQPPGSFGVSLVAKDRAERLVACQLRADYSCPAPTGPPRRHGYRYLGEAVPPPGGNDPEHGDPPRYLLRFEIPPQPAGEYSYVIWCDACRGGRAGSLIADPASPTWRLTILSPARRGQRSDISLLGTRSPIWRSFL